MANIFPFAGLRYNVDRIQDLAGVISPPYDKISPAERSDLWNRHEFNVVRLILPPPDGMETDFATQASAVGDWYSHAAETLQSWIRQGLLKNDTPRLYVYRQSFPYLGVTYTRTGLFVALQLDEQGGPLAHENTFEGPKADRFRLIHATKTNLSPIFLLADGSMNEWESVLSKTEDTLIQFDDLDGQHHQLLSIATPDMIQSVQEFIRSRVLVIADGHHRYETAQNYKRLRMQETGQNPEGKPWGSVMALIVPAASPDLLVLPTHRVIQEMPDGWLQHLQEQARPYGTWTPLKDITGSSLHELLSQSCHQASIAVIGKEQGFLFTLSPDVIPPSLQVLEGPLRRLNVSILHQFLFSACLKLTPTALQGITKYIRGEEEAISLVKSGSAKAAFILGGLSPQTVLDVSQHHVRMPQKSTDFYPKIPTGLIFREAAG